MQTHLLLYEYIIAYFNLSELKDLIFRLGLNYENILGITLEEKAQELVSYCRRHGQLQKLVEKCKALRPFLPWEESLSSQNSSRPDNPHDEITHERIGTANENGYKKSPPTLALVPNSY